MIRKLLACFMILLLLLPACAGAEPEYWICSGCGQGGNNGNFCTNCGTARPVSDVIEGLTQIPGETDRVSVDILRIDDSGYVTAKKDPYLYASWNAIDEDPETCWQFSVKNIKKNSPWICMVVEGQTIDEIWFRNGFQGVSSKGKSLYPDYGRLKEISVVFVYTDESIESETMTFTLSDDNGSGWEKLDTGRHEDVDLVWIYVNAVYKGKSKPNNACLSELMFVQRTPAEKAKAPIE